MAAADGMDASSGTDEAVAVQRAMVLAYRTYVVYEPREREVGEALVEVGYERAQAQRCTVTMAAMVVAQCGLT